MRPRAIVGIVTNSDTSLSRWAYLTVYIDLFARKSIGCATSFSSNSQLTVKSVKVAYGSRGMSKGVMRNKEQVTHCTSRTYRQTLGRYQIKQTLSRRGNRWDNSPMDHFLRSLTQHCWLYH